MPHSMVILGKFLPVRPQRFQLYNGVGRWMVHGRWDSSPDYPRLCSLPIPELNALQEELEPFGLVILGFPCNQFGKQEPGENSEILASLK